jgi:hypothetical protein
LTDLESELESLQSQLSSRSSVSHFAHAAVSMALALIVGGASAKMFWDLDDEKLVFAVAVASLSVGLAVYSTTRYVLGRRKQQHELQQFRKLEALRRTLQLDDPSKLLPP